MNGIFIGIIVAMGVGGFFYWDTTSKQLTEYQSQVLAYEMKFAVQEETINTMITQHETQTEALVEMQTANQEIIAERDRYLDVFRRHDLAKLASAKPGLLEPRVNRGTKDVFDSLEQDSSFDFSPGTP